MEKVNSSIEVMEEAELFLRYIDTKDVSYRNAIVSKYINLADFLARKFINRGVDYDDIYQVACMALIKAVDRFSPDKGVKFVSFATPTILGEIKRFFRDKSTSIKIPRRLYEARQGLNKARDELTQELKRVPRADEIAAFMGISVETVLEIIEAGSSNSIKSLDQSIYQDNETDLSDTLGYDEKTYEKIENRDFLERTLKLFGEVERDFISLRYMQNLTQKQIAEKFGVSQMYISRLEKKILDRFRTLL
ncbi:SigB/SigF/SigG family RNA polymerase sigma factor [Ruminiclostridium cellobioparum]|uniref:RNA polymerase sigma factor, sigma-70 family/RNA polymerase sigma-70 factor, sigma-B/F/G subfamily n=1 Tax=Ruminiclostridium cellobioparum subsp. termitidis CT1112 TaxID=1195236 RepID=S0FHM1_RUMCE|nr:SigB/SigF/SigG family RNA polymerase sigma factor [Ruminiclostridium cellobioparum]EMS70972.1 RNA polymerase sigma factor, sigma-70 family/RNA polymerase sigma-70 factor, sigma-B/F/G subfamily [Ruminiclostridium cellobioparum subsp. termitidis CT1112]